MALRIGDHAPNFTAYTSQGPIELYDWKRGRWAMLLSELSDAEAAVHFPRGWIAVTPYLRVVPHPPS